MSDTKNPLWKQLVGALAGAAVAFVIYTAYTTVSGALQAAVTLPTAPDVKYSNELRLSNTESTYAERLLRRMQQAAWKLTTVMPGTVRRESDALIVTSNAELAQNTPTTSPTAVAPTYLRPTATYESPAQNAVAASSSSVSSSSSQAPHPPLSTAWLRRYQQPKTNSFASSASSVSAAPDAAAAAPLMGAQASAQATASSSSDGMWIPTGPVQRVRVTVPQSSSSSKEWANQMTSSSVPTAVLAATAVHKQTGLPKSGFGLGLIAATAIGAAIGRRKMKKA